MVWKWENSKEVLRKRAVEENHAENGILCCFNFVLGLQETIVFFILKSFTCISRLKTIYKCLRVILLCISMCFLEKRFVVA